MADLALPALLALAFSAGTATFFAPCAFPLLPGYLSYFLGETVSATETETETGTPTRPLVDRVDGPLARAGLVGLAVSFGITVVYVGLAGTTAALGARALADIAILEVVVGGLFVVAGTTMAVGWKVPRSVVQLPERRRSVVGFFVFGVLYAGAAAGCTAPLFLAVVARGLTAGPLFGVGVAAAYAAGTSAVLVVVTGVSAVGSSSVISALTGYTERIYRIAGGLLALSGVAELYYYAYGFSEVVP